MNSPIISIILPSYNSETILKNTIKTILNQSFHDFELIIIDDASSDNSNSFVKEIQEKDHRVRLFFNDESRGIGFCRNKGLNLALGKYIVFLDSSYSINENFLEILYTSISTSNSDISICDFNYLSNGHLVEKCECKDIPLSFRPQNYSNTLFQIISPFLCNKLYRTSFIQSCNIKFIELNNSNDYNFVYTSIAKANLICHTKNNLISQNQECTNSPNLSQIFTYFDALYSNLHKIKYGSNLIPSFLQSIESTLGFYINNHNFDYLSSHINKNLRLIRDWEALRFFYIDYTDIIDSFILKNPLISILIPVYNSEHYIGKAINSLLSQTFKYIEVICVNDGSTDNSLNILNSIARKDYRLKVINQVNSGPAAARNNALKHSTAPFIMFCDSDDWYEPSMCEEMIRSAFATNADLIMCDSNVIAVTNDHNRSKGAIDYHHLHLFGYINLDDEKRKCISVVLWNKLFRSKIIRKFDISFPSGFAHEDASFVCEYLAYTESAYGLNKPLYNYFLRKDSIMGTLYSLKNKKQIYDIIDAMEHAILSVLKNEKLDSFKFITSVIAGQTLYYSKFLSFDEKIYFFDKLKKQILSKIPTIYLKENATLSDYQKKSSEECAKSISQNKSIYLIKKVNIEKGIDYRILGASIFKIKKINFTYHYYLFGLLFYKRHFSSNHEL